MKILRLEVSKLNKKKFHPIIDTNMMGLDVDVKVEFLRLLAPELFMVQPSVEKRKLMFSVWVDTGGKFVLQTCAKLR